MNSSYKKFILTSSLLAFIGCSKSNLGTQADQDANLSTVTLKIPYGDDAFKSNSGQSLLTGYNLKIDAEQDKDCKFTNVNETKPTTSLKLDYRLKKNCKYSVNLSLGQLVENSLSSIYFSATKPQTIEKDAINKAAGALTVALDLIASADFYSDASQESVEKLASQSGKSQPLPNPSVPNPIPKPEVKPSGNLDPKFDLDLITASGQQTKLSALVAESPYFFIDFSAPWCGPCLNLAQQLEADAQFKKIFSAAGKCKSITVALDGRSGNSLSEWINRLKSMGIDASDHSFGATNEDDVKRKFNVSSYPMALLFSKSDSSMSPLRDSQSIPAEVVAACQ